MAHKAMTRSEFSRRRTYEFPNAYLHVYPHDRTCREQPKWCLCISVERSRSYVAEALRELRRRRSNP